MKKMANPFFDALKQSIIPQQQKQPNIFDAARQIRSNPLAFIAQKKMHLGPDVNVRDPNAMLQYLVDSGQVPQSRVDWAKQQLSHFGGGR